MSPGFEFYIMNRLLAYFGRLFIVLCLLGHGVTAFASENTCVDEDTLKGFYEKFSLLEQEKEALRTKLSSCSAEGEKAAELSVTLSQKDGRALRYLESKVSQLEEENDKLRDKLKALGALPDEDIAGEEPEDKPEEAPPEKDVQAEEAAPKISEPVEDVPLEGPVLPDGAVPAEAETVDPAPAEEKAAPAESAPVPEETVPAPDEDKKSDIAPVPEDAPPSSPELIETGSGGADSAATIAWNILKSDPLRADPAVKSAYEDACASEYQAFEKGLLKLASVEGERKTLSELSSQHKALVSGLAAAAGGEGSAFLCPDEAASKRLSASLERLEAALADAQGGQQAIQILYQENRKLESGGS